MGAFAKGTLRAIRGSLGRFLAIMGITALGCGFFAGLQMCGPDMRGAADAWYDDGLVWDLRLVSTLGWSDDDVARVADIEGIDAVMGATTVDAMADLGGEQAAVRISTFDVKVATASSAVSANGGHGPGVAGLNRMSLVEGRWPAAGDECVISADVVLPGVGVGSTVEVRSTAEGAEDLLKTRRFKVVGTITTAVYPYTANLGSTTLGAGIVKQCLYVTPQAMADDAVFTDLFVLVRGAVALESESAAYEDVVASVAKEVEGVSETLRMRRLDDLRRAAQSELDERAAELATARAEARSRLDAGKAELDVAYDELTLGEEQLSAGEASLAAGVEAYRRERTAVETGLVAAEAELDAGERRLAAGEWELAAGRAELSASEEELATRRSELLDGLSAQGLAAGSLEEAAASVATASAEAEAAVGRLQEAAAGIERMREAQSMLLEAEERARALAVAYEQASNWLLGKGYTQVDVDAAFSGAPGWLESMEAWARGQGMTDEELATARATVEQAQGLLAEMRELSDAKAEVARQEAALLDGLSAQGLAAGSLEEAAASVATASAEAEAAVGRLQEAAAGIERMSAAEAELSAVRAKVEASEVELAEGRRRAAAGRDELARGRAEALSQLANVAQQLDEGAAELAASRERLASGRASYEEGRGAWVAAKADADAQLADAAAQLADAQADLDSLEAGDIYVLDRTKNEGAATYHADTERMDAIAAVFPLMFFLVAALIALTTMTRMVEDERVQIGTYKALGYSTAAIAGRYLAYAASASIVGAVVGVAVLSQVLPVIVMSAYGIIYAVPPPHLPLPVSLPVALSSGGLGVGVTLVATWAAVVASLREAPAALMLPRAPAAGRRILLERVGSVWRHLSFSWKVTCRNLFRYKRRLLMTVVGVAGCTALLLVGFGLHDAIWDIIDCQYGPIIHYDTTIALDANATAEDVDELADYLTATGEVSGIVRVHGANMQASDGGDGVAMRVQVVVPERIADFERAVTLRVRGSHEPIAFDDGSVVVTEKLAMKYGIDVGGTVRLFEQDATGNVVGDGVALMVGGIAENYVGNLVYVGRRAWKNVDDATPVFSTLLASTSRGADVRSRLAATLHERPHVSTVAFSDETIDTYRTMLSVVDMIVVVLIVSAAALAFIVLYNLTNINIAERVREIASLKVLGFTRREVHAYVFREVFLLAIAGAALGMALGTWLATFVITTAEVDYVMFGRSIHPASYAYAFVLTLAFTVFIAAAMRSRLNHVDMVESLKSVD